MADVQTLPEISDLKNSKILVSVEEALLDFLVVSYEYDSKLYQGVLLDTSKRGLPCGIFAPLGFPNGADEDKLHSVSQRHTYFQDKSPPHPGVAGKDGLPHGTAFHMRRAMRGGQSRLKSSRMTVRLRPRQVLCSKCKSICNENSENVDLSKKRKGEETTESTGGHLDKRLCTSKQISPKSPRPPFSENPQDNKSPANSVGVNGKKKSTSPSVEPPVLRPSLIPKRLPENEAPSNVNGNVSKIKIVGGQWTRRLSSEDPRNDVGPSKRTITSAAHSSKVNSRVELGPLDSILESTVVNNPVQNHSTIATLTGPVADGSLQCSESDIDGESVLGLCSDISDANTPQKLNTSMTGSEADESQDRMVLRKKRNVGSMEDLWDESVFLEDTMRRTTPVIKISFGSQGEGTVLKIPAKVRSYHASESETEEVDVEGTPPETITKDASAKAAKRALKRAKKEARRKVGGGTSPAQSVGGSSPAYDSALHSHRRKRKVKHKKRHKNARAKHSNIDTVDVGVTGKLGEDVEPNIPSVLDEDPLKLDTNPNSAATSWDDSSTDYNSMKERCLKQKLSISLKRLNATAYARCGDSGSSAGSNSPGSNSELSGADELPDFPGPPTAHPIMMRVSTQTVGSCLTGDGRTMEVGDVVWGKIHGFPWWPGKVLSITVSRKDDGAVVDPQAHVAWYGSSTSSLMPCDQLSPFLETFKTRYNKKKRGPYKEAIRQATSEAKRESHEDSLQEVDVVS